MSALGTPSNIANLFPAAPTNHVINFQRMPNTSVLVQGCNLPGVTTNLARVGVPGPQLKFTGDKLNYEPLTITYMIDEEFRVHQELYAWLVGATGAEDRARYVPKFMDDQKDFLWDEVNPATRYHRATSTTAGLTIVSGGSKPLLRILFFNVYISALGPVDFNTTTLDTTIPLVSTATFEYDYWVMTPLS